MSPKDIYPKIKPYNPLDKRNLGESVAEAALNAPIHPLPPEPFIGAGVYLLYYIGNHPIYKSLSDLNKEDKYTQPIYVGKAVPAGARKGGGGLDVEHGTALYNRLSEHAASIASVEDLDLGDFRCRFLVVDDIWIPLAESLLIKRFAPVWNRVLDGFGNHDPGKGRYQGKKPFWDAVHPGREWADRLQPGAYTREELMRRVEAYLQRLDKPV
ncbi:MAG: Eco29kI family restriction endonuclease [bacterium]